MKNSMSKALWGVFFVLLGVALAGRAVGVFDFNIYFPGWWTLFIIVPSAIGLVDGENRTASLFGLGIGVLLLASVQGFINWYTFPRLIIALIFVVIGFSFLFKKEKTNRGEYVRREYGSGDDDSYENREYDQDSGYHEEDYQNFNQDWNENQSQNDHQNQEYNQNRNDYQDQGYNQNQNQGYSQRREYDNAGENGQNQGGGSSYNGSTNHTGNQFRREGGHRGGFGGYNHYTGFLSGRNIQFVDEEFIGADITSILGNVQLDLRNAILNDDVIIDTTCILGGVDVYVPRNVKVVLNCTPILGGVENKMVASYNPTEDHHTIFIRGTCILGGIEVK
jgi:predicted membrane protein